MARPSPAWGIGVGRKEASPNRAAQGSAVQSQQSGGNHWLGFRRGGPALKWRTASHVMREEEEEEFMSYTNLCRSSTLSRRCKI